ncbi:MAG: pyruvate, water dikinase regulatory protein [Gemmatimonadota bacterium]|nr:pyruvate, water dikinase regulatory protein [Gemmatimonadota bacterium]
MSRRTVFFVSDSSGVTAETLGHSLLTQFDGLDVKKVTVPFVSSGDKALQTVRMINLTAEADGVPPIVFSTLVEDSLRDTVRECRGVFLDFFDSFLAPLELELGVKSAHATGRAHSVVDSPAYDRRIDAVDYALAHDDGSRLAGYDRANVILVGVSRSGKTPTCLYLALQYGIYAANFPLTEDEFENRGRIATLPQHRDRLFGLTIAPERLEEIRNERRPGSTYASSAQVGFEIRQAEGLFRRLGIPYLDTTRMSIEEIASRILDMTGLERGTAG